MSKFLPGTHKLESLGYGENIVTCEQNGISEIAVNWEGISANTEYENNTRVQYQNVFILPKSKNAVVKAQSNDFGKTNGLELSSPDGMEIIFPESVSKILPKVSSENNVVVFTWYKKISSEVDENYRPIYNYSKVAEDVVDANNLSDYEGYNNPEIPIDKLVISIIPGPSESVFTDDLRLGVNWYPPQINPASDWTIMSGDNFQLDDFMMFEKALTEGEITDWKNANNLPANPIAHYKFDGNLDDSGKYEFDGSGPGTIAYSKDRFNQSSKSILFTHSTAFSVDHNDRLCQDVGNFSIGFWFRNPTQMKDKTALFFPVFTKMGFMTTSPYNVYYNQLWLEAEVDYFNNYNFNIGFYRDSEMEWMSLNNWEQSISADNNWHHVTLVGDRYSKKLHLYWDGKKTQTTDIELFTNDPIEDVCQAFVHEITYLDAESHHFNLKIPGQSQINTENQKMADALTKTIQPVWRPDTKYAIQLSYKDKVDGTEHYQHYHLGFQTRGPIGHFHQTQEAYAALKADNRQDEYKLAGLQHYLDFDRCVPPANGDLQKAKPVYYSEPSLKLFFNRPYAYVFYNNWVSMTGLDAITSELKLAVKDATGDLDADALEGTWIQRNGQTIKTEDESMLLRLAARGENCSGLPTEITKINYMSEYVLPDLEPGKLYTAIYNAEYKIGSGDIESEQVHTHVFNTSRYPDFESHINSFVIYNENDIVKKAVFALSSAFESGQITIAKSIFNTNGGSDEMLIKEYSEIYDRLLFGGLEIKQPDAPICTEVTRIYNSTTEKTIGLLLRSPEPFVDPRMGILQLAITPPLSMSITLGNSTIDNNYSMIFSNDKTSVFISNKDFDIPEGTVSLEFTNVVFDGDSYSQTGDPVSLVFSLSND